MMILLLLESGSRRIGPCTAFSWQYNQGQPDSGSDRDNRRYLGEARTRSRRLGLQAVPSRAR